MLDDPMAEALASLGRPVMPPEGIKPPRRSSSVFAPPAPTEPDTSQPFKTSRGVLKFQPEQSDWSLSRLGDVQSTFKQRVGIDLPVKVRGQGAIHNKWKLDHRDSADIGLNPNSKEGQAFISQLREQNIPFLAFDHAIPGVATSAHIHVGRPSHHLGQAAQDAPLQNSYDTALSPEGEGQFQQSSAPAGDDPMAQALRELKAQSAEPKGGVKGEIDQSQPLPSGAPTPTPQPIALRQPRTSSRVTDDTGAEVPAAFKPLVFQEGEYPAQDERLTGLEELTARRYREKPAASTVLGAIATAKLPANKGGNADGLAEAVMSAYGPEYVKLNDLYRGATGRNMIQVQDAKPDREGNFSFAPSKQVVDFINAFGQGVDEGGVQEGIRRAAEVKRGASAEQTAAVQNAREAAAPDIKEAEAGLRRAKDSPVLRGMIQGVAPVAQQFATVIPGQAGEELGRQSAVERAISQQADIDQPLQTTGERIKAGLGAAVPTAMNLAATAPLRAAQLPTLGVLQGTTPEERLKGGLQGAAMQAGFSAIPAAFSSFPKTGAATTAATMVGMPATEAWQRGESPIQAITENLPFAALALAHGGRAKSQSEQLNKWADEFDTAAQSRRAAAEQIEPKTELDAQHRDQLLAEADAHEKAAQQTRTYAQQAERQPLGIENAPVAGVPGKATANIDQILAAREAAVRPPVDPQSVERLLPKEPTPQIYRSQEPDAGPPQYRGMDEGALLDLAMERPVPKGTSKAKRQQIAEERAEAKAELQRRRTQETPMEIVPPDTGLRAGESDVPSFQDYVENRPGGGIRFETLEPGSPDFDRLAQEYTDRYGTRSQPTERQLQPATLRPAEEAPTEPAQPEPVAPKQAAEPVEQMSPVGGTESGPRAQPIDYEREVQSYLDGRGRSIEDVTSDPNTRDSRDITTETAEDIANHLQARGINADETAVRNALYDLRERASSPESDTETTDPMAEALSSLQEKPTEQLLLDPAAAHLKTIESLKGDDPLNPKVIPLVAALNDAGVPTVMSGDLYGKNIVYVDLPGGKYTEGKLTRGADKYERALRNARLPEGWKVIRADTIASTAFETGKPESFDLKYRTGVKKYTGPRPTATRLIRKGGEVAPAEAHEVAQAVKAALSRPLKVLSTPSAELEPVKTPGQKLRVGNLDSEVIDAQRLNDVDYELYKAGDKGAVRVYDADSGNVVSITKYPKFSAAVKAYHDAVKAEGGDIKSFRDRLPANVVKELPAAETKAAREELPPVRVLSVGRESKAITERGSEIATRYALVDLNDLITSHDAALQVNPKFPPELQPRERERAASADQINRIATQLRPEFLGESPKASEGAPIIGDDGIVESGNGRVLALRQAYEAQDPRSRDAYKQFLSENAERLGLDPNALADSKQPVLVRVRTSEVDRPQFVKEANEQSIASMSAMEQARSDAKSLKGPLLDLFQPSDSGEINTLGNMPFVRAFMRDVVGENERGRYQTASGQLSTEGIARIRNAIFARAFADTPEGLHALEKLAESPDNNVRNVTNAMLRNAAGFASLKEGIDQGTRYPLDISPDIAAAMSKMSALRDEGMPVGDYLNQGRLYGEDLTPTQKRLLQVFDEYKRGANTIDSILKNYLRGADAAGSPDQVGLFGNETPSKASFLEAAIQEAIDAHNKATTPDLFAPSDKGLPAKPASRRADQEANAPARMGQQDISADEPTFAPRLAEPQGTAAQAEAKLSRLDSVIDRLKAQEEEARQRIAARGAEFLKQLDEKGSELGASTIPQDLYDYVVIGATKLAQKSLNVAQFVDEMVRDFGEDIRKHARTIFKLSQKKLADEQKDFRDEQVSREIANRLFTENVPYEQQRQALKIAGKFRTSTDTQNRLFTGFKSRVGEMARSYGAAGGELANRLHLGDIARGHEMEAGNQYLSKIQDVYAGVKNDFERMRISDAVINALENRSEADRYLDTPQKRAVYKDTKEMLDHFRERLNALGYETREDYFTHIRDVDILDQIISDAKDPKDANLNELVAAKSRFLQPRDDAKIEIKRDLPKVLFAYLKSVTKEIAYGDAVQYYYDHFPGDIPISLRRNSMDRAIKLMQNSLKPEQGRGPAYRIAGRLRANQYQNFLAYNFKAAAQNFTQVDFARMRWTKEATRLANRTWRQHRILTGPIADAIDIALWKQKRLTGPLAEAMKVSSTEQTPLMRFLEQSKGDEPSGSQGRLSKRFNELDPFQFSEKRNWAFSELGSIINSVVKRPEYEKLKAKLGAENAINKLLEKQDVFDAAVREAATTAAETQVAGNPAMRGEFYDKPLNRIIGMFTAFKTRQMQVLAEALRSHEGINGARAQTILRRGLSGDAHPVEVLREVEAQRRAMEKMVKQARRFNEDIGISYADMGEMIKHLKTQEADLNGIIKQREPLSGGRGRSAMLTAKYFAKVAAISVFFNLFWNSVYDAISPPAKEQDADERLSTALHKAFWDVLPSPFYGANPSKFLVSPIMPNFEQSAPFGHLTRRGLARDVVSYSSSVIPFAGIVDRMANRRLSGALVDVIAPKKEKVSNK